MPPATEETRPIAFRLPYSLIERLDAHAERMGRTTPGMQFTRTDALRVLLLGALEVAEAQAPPTPPPSPRQRIPLASTRRPATSAPTRTRPAPSTAAGPRKSAGQSKRRARQD